VATSDRRILVITGIVIGALTGLLGMLHSIAQGESWVSLLVATAFEVSNEATEGISDVVTTIGTGIGAVAILAGMVYLFRPRSRLSVLGDDFGADADYPGGAQTPTTRPEASRRSRPLLGIILLLAAVPCLLVGFPVLITWGLSMVLLVFGQILIFNSVRFIMLILGAPGGWLSELMAWTVCIGCAYVGAASCLNVKCPGSGWRVPQ